jgi:hypothetical protein
MQLINVISAAAAMAVTVSARSAITLNKSCDTSKPHAKVINRCPYEVNLWSVYKGNGCPSDEMVTLQPGETYSENYADPQGGDVGVSIKISKTNQCKGNPITQLEYFLQKNSPGFNFNYLDVSYVDCQSNEDDCPTRQEGYHLVAGSQTGAVKAAAENTWCPVLSCSNPKECNKISYVGAYDVQTKTCETTENMEFYMCGGEAPGNEPAPSSSSSPKAESSAAPSTTLKKQTSAAPKPTQTQDSYDVDAKVVAAAAVTPGPKAEEPVANLKTKTEVVYVTAYQTVNAKRHAHGHARRHAAYNA